MPTLNYENVGALVEYDYLQGTILALYSEDDTADIESESEGSEWTLLKVPIFYHCEPTSTARSNGALEGAAGGFAVGDLVVVLKAIDQAASSLYSLTKIELKGSKSTATGPKYYVVGHYGEIKKCQTLGIIFISVNGDNLLEYYEYNSKLNTTSLLKTVDICSIVCKEEFASRRIQPCLIHAEGAMNCVVLSAFVTDWRGNFVSYPTTPSYVWYLFNKVNAIKIPLDFYDDTHINTGCSYMAESQYPSNRIMGTAGRVTYAKYPLGGAFESVQVSGSRALTQLGPFNDWARGYGFSPDPISGNDVWRYVYAVGEFGGLVMEAYWSGEYYGYYDEHISYLSAGLIIFNGDNIELLRLEESPDPGTNLPSATRAIQILGYDSKFYVFYGQKWPYTSATYYIDVSVIVYDLELNVVIAKQTLPGTDFGDFISRVQIIDDGRTDYLCFRSKNSGNVILLDPETLSVLKTVSMPESSIAASITVYDGSTNIIVGGEETPNFIACTKPKTNYMLEKINEYRFTLMTEAQEYAVARPLEYLGYSGWLEEIARQHAVWCAANGRMQHEGAGGYTVQNRAPAFGFRGGDVGENLAMLDIREFPTLNSQIDAVIQMWKDSPAHLPNLIGEYQSTFGYYATMFPESVHSIIVGPYLGYAGETIVLDPSAYGKMKLFVYNVAGTGY